MSDRIVLQPVAAAAPGKCVVCGYAGGDAKRKFIDFQFDIEFYGAVYFCTNCFDEIARKIGYDSPIVSFGRNASIQNLKQELDKVKEENGKLRTIVDTYRTLSPDATKPASSISA